MLIRDEATAWQNLLNNTFCQKMKTASSRDIQVTKGFKWYMVVGFLIRLIFVYMINCCILQQDFLYCGKLMLFDTERATRAPDEKTYEELPKKIESHTRYSRISIAQYLHSEAPHSRGPCPTGEEGMGNKAVYRVHYQRC